MNNEGEDKYGRLIRVGDPVVSETGLGLCRVHSFTPKGVYITTKGGSTFLAKPNRLIAAHARGIQFLPPRGWQP